MPYQLASETIAVGNEVFSIGYPLADVIGETENLQIVKLVL
jgi:hypothetical protein